MPLMQSRLFDQSYTTNNMYTIRQGEPFKKMEIIKIKELWVRSTATDKDHLPSSW